MKYLNIILIILSLCHPLLAQKKKQIKKNPTKYPYGGKPDKGRKKKLPKKIDSDYSLTSKEKQKFKKKIPLNFSFAQFDSAQFSSSAYFSSAQFPSSAYFSSAQFSSSAYFLEAQFSSSAYFRWAQFDSSADFRSAQFSNSAYFSSAQFSSSADFRSAQFDSSADFYKAQFSSLANFSWATFKEKPEFTNTTFKGILNFRRSHFKKGIDLTEADLDSIHTINLLDAQYPEGQLKLYWSQFQAKDSLRIKIKFNKNDSIAVIKKVDMPDTNQAIQQELYRRTEKVYHKLRDNFLAQGKGSQQFSDDVMYELAWQKQEILNGFWWRIYGWFFGWGYQPWRFLILITILFLLPFSIIWYRYFYHLVLPILEKELEPKILKVAKSKINLKRKKIFTIYNHSRISQYRSILARMWDVVFFSASVLFSIRFKKDWIEGKSKAFLGMITIEWIIGLALYIVFAILVKTAQFAFIKGLIGF